MELTFDGPSEEMTKRSVGYGSSGWLVNSKLTKQQQPLVKGLLRDVDKRGVVRTRQTLSRVYLETTTLVNTQIFRFFILDQYNKSYMSRQLTTLVATFPKY
ncbi:hypothetical protein PV326_013856 [Microctonus aethiopoides]|nr:hypothetical protein PV326_013856 [Microctonus aethiopoides]